MRRTAMSETARQRADRLRAELPPWNRTRTCRNDLDDLIAAEVEAAIEERTVEGSEGWYALNTGDAKVGLNVSGPWPSSESRDIRAALIRLPGDPPCD